MRLVSYISQNGRYMRRQQQCMGVSVWFYDMVSVTFVCSLAKVKWFSIYASVISVCMYVLLRLYVCITSRPNQWEGLFL